MGRDPRSAVVGDFNRDGRPDLVLVNSSDRSFSILRNTTTFDPAGGFEPATVFAAGARPSDVAVGDFDGDGKLDLATANSSTDTVSILLGTGSDAFGPATNFSVGRLPRSVAVGDFDGDGKLDLATANQLGGTVSIRLGTGSGTFGPATNFSVGTSPVSVAVGDFNGDGKLDLAVLSDNTVSIRLGNGDGTFGPVTDFTVGIFARSMAAGDFNRDGKLDLAVAKSGSDTVAILLGNGDGTFGAATNFPVGITPDSVAVGDFNGDGKLDLAVAKSGSDTVSILLGNGDGTFGPATDFAVGSAPSAVAVGDFNRDGKLDLAVANSASNTVSILLGNGDGTFGAKTDFSVEGLFPASGQAQQPASLAVGDFNRDGKPDLVVANAVGDTVSILLNTAPGASTPGLILSVIKTGSGSGTVSSNPQGIDCGVDCFEAYATGTIVTLTATPAAGSRFVRWSEIGCPGTGPCTVTVQSALVVTATFDELNTPTGPGVTVTPVDPGTGTSPIDVTFDSVTQAGTTTVSSSPTGPATPAGFKLGNPPIFYQITTSAVFPSDLKATICVRYGGTTFTELPLLLHFENGAWIDVTVSRDTVNKIVCGRVASLSPFTLVEADTVAGTASSVAAVLPSSRSVQVGVTATAFATIINIGPDPAVDCRLSLLTPVPATFAYQATNPATNQVVGTKNAPVDVSLGAAQSFVFALTPTAPIAPTDVQLSFDCSNSDPAPINSGLNTLLFSASATPVPDIVALAATLNNDGIVHVAGPNGTGVFSVASVNVGATDTVTVSVDTADITLPLMLSLCETNPTTGQCISAIGPGVTTTINANATPTFGIFVTGHGTVPFSPAVNRIFVRFSDAGGVSRGATSVAVQTE